MTDDLMDFRVAPEFADLPVEDLGEGIVSGFSSIRIKGKAWALRHQGETYYFDTPTIDVVVLARAARNSQAYYPGQYSDDAEGRAPICTSLDGEHIDPDVEEPQAETCSVCPRNEWKGPRNERRKECQTYRRLAVLLIPTVSAKLLGTALLEPVFLKVPPGSLGNLKKYGALLKEKNVPMQSCITTLGFAPPNVSLFAITFKCTQMLKGGEAKIIKPLIGAADTQRLIGEAKIIHETADEQTPPLEPPKKVETGIEEAFGQRQQEVIPPKRGRPPGSKNKPKEDNGGRGFAVSDVDTRGTDVPPKQAAGFQGLTPGSQELTAELDKLDKMMDD